MSEGIEIIEVYDDGTALVSTKDRYRVVLHREDGDEICDELDEARGALAYANSFNFGNRAGESWVEVVDYDSVYRRQERENHREDIDEAVERRLEKLAKEKAATVNRPAVVRRLLTRAAAMIW